MPQFSDEAKAASGESRPGTFLRSLVPLRISASLVSPWTVVLSDSYFSCLPRIDFFCLFFIFGSLFSCALVSSLGYYLLFCYKGWCVPGPVWSHWLRACLEEELWRLFLSFLIVQYLIPAASLSFADSPHTTTTIKKKK